MILQIREKATILDGQFEQELFFSSNYLLYNQRQKIPDFLLLIAPERMGRLKYSFL